MGVDTVEGGGDADILHAQEDLNPQPPGLEPGALANWAIGVFEPTIKIEAENDGAIPGLSKVRNMKMDIMDFLDGMDVVVIVY